MDDNTSGGEIERLKVQVADLTRRLKNAQLTIEAERTIARNATAQADLYRQQIGYMSHMLRLETAKTVNIETKSTQQHEAKRFEELKEKAAELHQKVRVEEVDHWMTKNRKEPLKLQRMREKLAKMEGELDSQKKLLQEMTETEKLSEQLSTAAQMGDLIECSRLLKAGAWVNSVDAAGFLPIHYACSGGFYEVVKLCLEYGADHSSFLTGYSPVVVAASKGHTDIITLLLSFGASLEDKGSARCPATIAALTHGHFETFAHLLNEAGADVDAFDANENTALHLAVRLPDRERSIQVLLYLLEKGADTTKLNRKGHTPLQVALYDENKPAAHALGAQFEPEITPAVQVPSKQAQRNRTQPEHAGRNLIASAAGAPPPGTRASTEEVQYLPRSLDAPVRPSPQALLASTSSAALPASRTVPVAAGLSRSATLGTDGVRARRAAALDGLSAQLSAQRQKGLLHDRPMLPQQTQSQPPMPSHMQQGPVPQGSGAAAVRGVAGAAKAGSKNRVPAEPIQDTAAVTVIPSSALQKDGLQHENRVQAQGGTLGEELPDNWLEESAAVGMLDSQSVISAVTFGTAKFDS